MCAAPTRSPAPAPPHARPAPEPRDEHDHWLLELTQIPTAAGREWRTIDWIRAWAAERPDLALSEDPTGNLTIAFTLAAPSPQPARPAVYITAHLDHPAFVVERLIGPGTVELAFRGGVMDPYFPGARVVIHSGGRRGVPARPLRAVIHAEPNPANNAEPPPLFKHYLADLDAPNADAATLAVGDVATWDLPPAEIDANGLVHTAACDDLAAAAAALSAFDRLRALRAAGERTEDVRLLFTRAEEIGFIGAIAACRDNTVPRSARIVTLENSRAFADSPIGGGPIVRVGDRLSVFSPRLTAACAKRAEDLTGHPATPHATSPPPPRGGGEGWAPAAGPGWQRKLMPGGACEATVFCAFGFEATCLCLPLGNYHNMADLADVQSGKRDPTLGPPRVAREFISLADYHGLIDLLIAIGRNLPEEDPAMPRIQNLFQTRSFVLDEK